MVSPFIDVDGDGLTAHVDDGSNLVNDATKTVRTPMVRLVDPGQ